MCHKIKVGDETASNLWVKPHLVPGKGLTAEAQKDVWEGRMKQSREQLSTVGEAAPSTLQILESLGRESTFCLQRADFGTD